MIVKKVRYDRSFNMGNFESEKIGFEADIEDGDLIEDVIAHLKALAVKGHREIPR